MLLAGNWPLLNIFNIGISMTSWIDYAYQIAVCRNSLLINIRWGDASCSRVSNICGALSNAHSISPSKKWNQLFVVVGHQLKHMVFSMQVFQAEYKQSDARLLQLLKMQKFLKDQRSKFAQVLKVGVASCQATCFLLHFQYLPFQSVYLQSRDFAGLGNQRA